MARFVNEEQIASVVKILALEIFCSEFKLDSVVTYDANAPRNRPKSLPSLSTQRVAAAAFPRRLSIGFQI
jgi:hypothetical protein